MTIEELYDFIRNEFSSIYAFTDNIIADMKTLISVHKNFNPEKFYEWYMDRNVRYRTSPVSFLTKCGFDDIKRGLFDDTDVTEMTPNYTPLFNAMRQNNITIVNGAHTYYIAIVEDYIIKHRLMTVEELREWNRTAIAYLSNKGKTSEDFIYLFKNTRAMRSIELPFSEFDRLLNEMPSANGEEENSEEDNND